MFTTQFFHRILCIGFSLWANIVSEAGLVPQLSDMAWLRNSISKADARTFCTDILELCDGPLNNFTSIQNSASHCGMVECCRSLPSLTGTQQSFSGRLSAAKEHQIKNMCFAKWAYSEMLEDNKLRFEALQKIDRLMLLEKESSKRYKRQRLLLEYDLKQIANRIVGSPLSTYQLSGKANNTLEEEPVLKRSLHEMSHDRASRSSSSSGCRMIMTTVLASYAPNCALKSILIWYCQGTCNSRSVPQSYGAIMRNVEHCTCCSAQTMRYKTVTFRCTTGDVPRRVAWPFECACRPCSSVATMEQDPSS